ncbi:MAG: histidine phosphatase family protein [Synergistaceae bacterium]|nr:histidine phosphatase family protein [Synergistaceae bacterium]
MRQITKQVRNKETKFDSPGFSIDFSGKKIVFVRHGKSIWNLDFRYQGRTDIELCQEGIDGAFRVAKRLKQFPADVIITSPLKRAYVTARIISAENGDVPIEKNPLLIEADFGKLEGKTIQEINEIYGQEIFIQWKKNLLDNTLFGGESAVEIITRHKKFVQKLLKRAEKNIVLVGHGAEARALFITLLGEKPSSIFWKCAIENCSISTFLQKDDSFTLYTINDTLHHKVPGDLISSIPIF